MCDRGPQNQPTEAWDSAEAYEQYVGRWSRLVAHEFLRWLAFPVGGRWLDVGCGTGALSQAILDTARPETVLGVGPSERYVTSARERIADPHANFEVGDARTLPRTDETFDAVVSGLVLNFVPSADQMTAVTEMHRTARDGGVVAAYVWDYAGGMQMMRHFWDAVIAVDPAARALDQGQRFPVCKPAPLATLFRDAGLRKVVVRAIEIPTVFRSFDDYWAPFLGGQGAAPGYVVSLDEDQRAMLVQYLRSHLLVAPDGSIRLTARAWAVRGERPPR